jgi:hypothetical protein
VNVLTAVSQLRSFDHAACDAALRNAQAIIGGVPFDRTSGDDLVYVRPALLLAVLAVTAWLTVRAWLGLTVPGRGWPLMRPATLLDKLWGTAFVGVCLYALDRETAVIVDYVTACRAIAGH